MNVRGSVTGAPPAAEAIAGVTARPPFAVRDAKQDPSAVDRGNLETSDLTNAQAGRQQIADRRVFWGQRQVVANLYGTGRP